MAHTTDLVKLKSTVVTDKDRLRFALFFAIAIHFIFIFGIRFVLPSTQNSQAPLSLDVTLAHRASLEPPKDADFIGQNNQLGAGEAKNAERPTTELEHFKSTEGVTTTPSLEIVPDQAKVIADKHLITSNLGKREVRFVEDKDFKEITETEEIMAEVSPDPQLLKQFNLEQSNFDKLETRGENEKGISAAVLASPDEAPYLEAWRNKVYDVGNRHYLPLASKIGNGKPKVRVSIDRTGNLMSVEITQASGNTLVDEMAKDLIRLASPYDPLPTSILKTNNVLVFERQINFEFGTGVSSTSANR